MARYEKREPLPEGLLEELYVRQELPVSDIAKRLRTSPDYVYHEASRYGLSRPIARRTVDDCRDAVAVGDQRHGHLYQGQTYDDI